MSLRIYLDDCANDKVLVKYLRDVGHEVNIPADADLTGATDSVHFERAVTESWTLLTKNPRDFRQLHEASSNHAGILAIYQDNDPTRDMTRAEIVTAIANLENAGIDIAGQFHTLND